MKLVSLVVSTNTDQTLDISSEEYDDIDTRSDLKVTQTSKSPESVTTSKPKRVIRIHARYTNTVAYTLPVIGGVPFTYREAV